MPVPLFCLLLFAVLPCVGFRIYAPSVTQDIRVSRGPDESRPDLEFTYLSGGSGMRCRYPVRPERVEISLLTIPDGLPVRT